MKIRTLPEWYPAAAVTVAPWVFIKAKYEGEQREDILRHEAVHVRDQQRFHVLWWLTYLLLLPVGPSFKAFWEWRAFKETLLVEWERLGWVTRGTEEQVIRWLSGPLYLWAVPRWYAARLVRAEAARLNALPRRTT